MRNYIAERRLVTSRARRVRTLMHRTARRAARRSEQRSGDPGDRHVPGSLVLTGLTGSVVIAAKVSDPERPKLSELRTGSILCGGIACP